MSVILLVCYCLVALDVRMGDNSLRNEREQTSNVYNFTTISFINLRAMLVYPVCFRQISKLRIKMLSDLCLMFENQCKQCRRFAEMEMIIGQQDT